MGPKRKYKNLKYNTKKQREEAAEKMKSRSAAEQNYVMELYTQAKEQDEVNFDCVSPNILV